MRRYEVLIEGIETGTNVLNPGPKSRTKFCWYYNCSKHANNELKIGPYVANRVFTKCILTFAKTFDIY